MELLYVVKRKAEYPFRKHQRQKPDMPEPKTLPLAEFHATNGARFVDFGGWNMPVQYSGILQEHRAVRQSAGLFDVSHMGEFHVKGNDAAAFLDYLLVNCIASAPVGKAIYSPMCYPNGGVVDDLIVYRTADNEFLLCVNASNRAKDFEWIQQQATASDLAIEVTDHSEDYALLAVQGPKAQTIMQIAGMTTAAELGRFEHREHAFNGHTVRIARTGYTGEDGFEIYAPTAVVKDLAQLLFTAGADHGLQLCGLGARDSLRLEAGLPLYGHELNDDISPLEAGLDWTVKFKKDDFIGKSALEAHRDGKSPRRMAYFSLEGRRIARAGTAVLSAEGQVVGTVCSGTLSPILDAPIGSALLNRPAKDDALHLDLRGHPVALKIKTPPLHKNRT
ncbi:MAG: Aminomethyltransferase [Opitutia bacterium UBA7350]|nr:MAG: Aminomethyltransferase [Opitutae bacterium UBA7350]